MVLFLDVSFNAVLKPWEDRDKTKNKRGRDNIYRADNNIDWIVTSGCCAVLPSTLPVLSYDHLLITIPDRSYHDH